MNGLDIRLLRRFSVSVDEVLIEDHRWTRKKARLLIKLLALAPGRQMHREQIIDILWPDADSVLGLNNLHKVIHAARRALEPDLSHGTASRFIVTFDLQVALADSAVHIDVEEFSRSAAEALHSKNVDLLEAAVQLYPGDLLEEDLYEDWVSIPRERLLLTYLQLLECLAISYQQARDPRAVNILNQLVTITPANEDAHRRLMVLYATSGQRHLAINQYRICAETLKRDLDAVPEPATLHLYRSIVSGGVSVVAPPVQASPTAHSSPPVLPKQKGFTRLRIFWVCLSLLMVGISVFGFLRWRGKARVQERVSLAVLPLHPFGASPDLEYIAEGITDGLINSLSRQPNLKVMARATVFPYKHRSDSREIGRELKVNHVLDGIVSRKNSTLTVEVELLSVSDGSQKWAHLYTVSDRQLSSLPLLLNSDLTGVFRVDGAQSPPPLRATGDPDAYRLYLLGRHFWGQRTFQGFLSSIEYYQRAIKRDPNYALAYSGLADSYGLLGFQFGRPADYFPLAQQVATKALQLDPNLAEAQTSLAMVSALYDWNWAAAEAQFQRAIAMNPGYATAHHWFGIHLCAMGRFQEASRELEVALDLDPVSPIVNLNSGYPAYYQRQYATAMKNFGQALLLDPQFSPAHEDLMEIFELQRKPAEAAREAVLWLRSSAQFGLAEKLERSVIPGDYTGTLAAWLKCLEAPTSDYVSPMRPARLAIRIGDKERGLFWLERALEERSPQLVYIAVDPMYDRIRSQPRFQALSTRIGLPSQ